MKTRRNIGGRVEEATTGGKPTPPQAPTAGVRVSFNQDVLTDGDVREALIQMAPAITAQP